jgi:hypothetical protein
MDSRLKRISSKTHEDDQFSYGEERWEDGTFITFWMQWKGRTYEKFQGEPYWEKKWKHILPTYEQKVKNYHIVEEILLKYHSKEKVQELMDMYHPYPKGEENASCI